MHGMCAERRMFLRCPWTYEQPTTERQCPHALRHTKGAAHSLRNDHHVTAQAAIHTFTSTMQECWRSAASLKA